MKDKDFYEDDEPVEDVIAAFERGELRFTSIDFSEAHFLDHSVWACLRDDDSRANRFGGVRLHLRYAWDFKWKPALRANTLCRINRHRPCKAWSRDREPQNLMSCGDCCKDLGSCDADNG